MTSMGEKGKEKRAGKEKRTVVQLESDCANVERQPKLHRLIVGVNVEWKTVVEFAKERCWEESFAEEDTGSVGQLHDENGLSIRRAETEEETYFELESVRRIGRRLLHDRGEVVEEGGRKVRRGNFEHERSRVFCVPLRIEVHHSLHLLRREPPGLDLVRRESLRAKAAKERVSAAERE